jgi:hypothetical protein
MNDYVTKIIQQAIHKQPTGVEVAFREAIKPAINRAIEVKRAEVGANLFTPQSK